MKLVGQNQIEQKKELLKATLFFKLCHQATAETFYLISTPALWKI